MSDGRKRRWMLPRITARAASFSQHDRHLTVNIDTYIDVIMIGELAGGHGPNQVQ